MHVEFSLDREEELHKEEQLEWLAAKRRLFILFAAYLRHFRVLSTSWGSDPLKGKPASSSI